MTTSKPASRAACTTSGRWTVPKFAMRVALDPVFVQLTWRDYVRNSVAPVLYVAVVSGYHHFI